MYISTGAVQSFTAVPSCICLSLYVCVISLIIPSEELKCVQFYQYRCHASHAHSVVCSLAAVCQCLSYLLEVLCQCYLESGRSLSVHQPSIKITSWSSTGAYWSTVRSPAAACQSNCTPLPRRSPRSTVTLYGVRQEPFSPIITIFLKVPCNV